MKTFGSRTAAFVLLLPVVGCAAAFEPTPHVTELQGRTVISNTASLAHSYVHQKQGDFFTCAMAQPDAAFDQADEMDFSISLVQVNNNQADRAGDSEDSEEEEMSGRTPAVLMAREFFFRTCEVTQNLNLNKKEALDLYVKTLEPVKAVWTVEAGNTTVTVGDTLTVTEGTTVSSETTQALSDTTSTTQEISDTATQATSDTTTESTSDTSTESTSDTSTESTSDTSTESSSDSN
ncbi:MAG: hypothetical protein QF384_22735 [Alphaproteobacteria bacterium]|nr:hypothetical protein [Alphaproteobacteria bacterium]